jgi:hypothetical protein
MKNNALWYLSPIAFAFLSATWISHSNLNNGAYEQVEGSRTIQSTSVAAQPSDAHCVREVNENITASAHPMMMVAGAQCPHS